MNARRDTTPPTGQLALILGGGSALTQVARQLGTALDRAFAELGLTAQQAALLMHTSAGDASPSRLMARLGTDTAGMTKLIDRLESKGLLVRRRSTTDRRAVVVEVTDTGRQLAPRLPIIFGTVTRQLFDGFTADELSALSAMLQRMGANLTTPDHATPPEHHAAPPTHHENQPRTKANR
jgi:DNA-binding MarR family transcriptional regulator